MNIRPLAKLLVNRPRAVLAVFLLLSLLIGSQAVNVYMQSDLTSFLPKDDPTLTLWNYIEEEFKLGSTIIIYVEADDIRSPEVLKEMDIVSNKINKFENDKGEQDGVYSVNSIAKLIKEENAKAKTLGGLGGTGKYEIPTDKNLISEYMARFLIQKVKGSLYTNTYDVAVIIIQLSGNVEYSEILDKAKDAVEYRGTFYSKMTVTGTIAMQYAIQEESMKNMVLILPIAVILVALVLFYFHRSLKGIIIAFLPPVTALLLTFGVLGMVAPELTIISVAVIALLAGLGVDYSIHIMNRYAEEYLIEDKIDRMEKTLASTGKAIFLSTVTTMIGFGSLMISSMIPMVTFGFACTVGILFCFISSIIMVPCFVLILDFDRNGRMHLWDKFAKFALDNKHRIIFIAVFFAVISLIVVPSIRTDVDYYSMAPKGLPELEKLQEYSDTFGGGANFNAFIVQTDPQGLTYPETIEALYNLQLELKEEGIIVYSIADELVKLNDILERNKIVDQLSEYAGVDKIIFDMVAEEGIITEDYSKTIVLVRIPLGKTMDEIEQTVNTVNQMTSNTVLPHNGKASKITGQDAVNVAINKKLAEEQVNSMIIALLLVLAVLILIFKSSIYGLLTMIPVFFILIWEPAILVALEIPLSVVTIAIASIMIGIGIDYGVHITQRVKEEIEHGMSRADATRTAIEKTGLSLIEAACTTIAGIISIYFVNVPSLQQFGLIVIIMVALSCIGAALILPAFINLKILR